MSRIGKKIINIPEKTEVNIDGTTVFVKGPLGELTRTFRDIVKIEKTEDGIIVNPVGDNKFAMAMWGTVNSHISNMIHGVNEKFEKKLIIEGVGFRAAITGAKIVLKVGFSHDVELDIPDGIEVVVEKSNITISGIDKEKVGLFASKVRMIKKPEPYKGKGIRYIDEIIIRKEGKKSS
ncbi:50S ribosomal protein L6 [sediment metagenome]|uniref:50S ribosomal protein L6 n=1 Tax=sediment metagenome TaxID=749907 RepID=D9PHB1_9ZZZZ